MKQLFNKNINLGIHSGLSKNEEKLIKLLNFICLIWYGVTVLFIITDYFIVEEYTAVLVGYLFQVTLFILVQLLQWKRKYIAARVLFVTMSHILVFLFCNVIIPGDFVDLFYILTPLFSLMFFQSRMLHYFYLVLAILSFVIPDYLWHNYPEGLFSDPTTIPVFFISIFLLVNYFKKLNIKSEKRLKKQKDIALKDKELISQQKKELQNLHDYQNQFFVNIAHEIRTPLTIIKGSVNRLQDCDAVAKDNLQTQASKIQRIVDDVMNLTKMDSNQFSLNKEVVDFSTFVAHIFHSFYSNFKHKEIDYQLYDTTDNNIVITADKIYLESAISNILTNALKYSDRKGKVSLILEQVNQQVILKIKDTGIGIAEDELDKVFNRFYQSNNSINKSGGSGIGLAFSKEIIKKHEGKITIESQKGNGSTFIFSLPISSFAKEEENQVSDKADVVTNAVLEKEENTSKDKKTILLVEDNPDMRIYIKEVFSGYDVVEAENGLEGIEKLKNNHIDFIVTDYMMPEMNGHEFVETIKKDNNKLPVLMLTAKSDIEVRLEMLRLGIDDYLTKPFEEEELLLRVKNGLKNYESQQDYIKEEKIPQSELRQDAITSKLINDLKDYIVENCTKEHFGILDICEDFALSQSTLFRRIKSLTGLNTKEFITEVRLQKANEIFENNKLMSLKEIGYKVGFLNYTHFGKLYEARFGMAIS